MVRSKENIEIIGKYEAICQKTGIHEKYCQNMERSQVSIQQDGRGKKDSIASWKHDSSESNCSQRHEELKRSPKIACSSTVAVQNKKN